MSQFEVATVTPSAYNPAWPYWFEEEREILAEVFAGAQVTTEHVGSTAVPGHTIFIV